MFAILLEVLLIEFKRKSTILLFWEGGGFRGANFVNKNFVNKPAFPIKAARGTVAIKGMFDN